MWFFLREFENMVLWRRICRPNSGGPVRTCHREAQISPHTLTKKILPKRPMCYHSSGRQCLPHLRGSAPRRTCAPSTGRALRRDPINLSSVGIEVISSACSRSHSHVIHLWVSALSSPASFRPPWWRRTPQDPWSLLHTLIRLRLGRQWFRDAILNESISSSNSVFYLFTRCHSSFIGS